MKHDKINNRFSLLGDLEGFEFACRGYENSRHGQQV